MNTLQRVGYGASFNELYFTDNILVKKAKNDYGRNKIKKEINFYKFLEKNTLSFPRPNIYYYLSDGYAMGYLQNTQQLYKVFGSFTQEKQNTILNKIYNHLIQLHLSSSIHIQKNELMECIHIEFYEKLINRYKEISDIVEKYSYITTVNNVKISTFYTTVSTIYERIKTFFEVSSIDTFSCIHGDCQFNNILINEKTDDLYFIDPRGFFGSKDIYGLKEYDYAKIQFALSGYDVFDNMIIDTLNISENNITIPSIMLTTNIFSNCSEIVKLITLSIWLGNAHSFKNNEQKVLFSYFYALYLCAKFS